MKKIGENIRFYRNLRGLTQTALARKVQVAPAYISQIEANQRVPSLKVTRRIASVLGIEMSVLVREADSRGPEGRLSNSEKLDLLRTLIMAIEGESREAPPAEPEAHVAGRDVVAREVYSEPAFCLVVREFTGSTTFGRESADTDLECHIVLEGRVRVIDHAPGRELSAGECTSLRPAGTDRLIGSRGARVVSAYAPRLPLASLVEQASAVGTPAPPAGE